MLKTFRDNLKHLKWTLWLVIIAFIVFYIPDLLTPGGPDSASAATVGDERVAVGEFQQAVRQQEELYQQQFGSAIDLTSLRPQIRRQALEQLVNQKVLLLEAKRMGLEVSDAELQRNIARIFSRDGRFVGAEEYRNILRAQRRTPADFERDLREDLLFQKMLVVLGTNHYVTDKAVEAAYRETVERAKVRFIRLTGDRYAEDVTVTDDEARAYFDDNRESYRLPEQRDVAYLLINSNELRGRAEISDEELNAYYQGNRSDFERQEQVRVRQIFLRTDSRSAEEARATLESAKQRIQGGESFGDVARELSEDPSSKERGGEMGFLSRGQMPPEFEQAAFGATQGELVGPVEAGFGVHLLEVQQRREGGVQPFEEVRGQVRNRVLAERMPQMIAERAAAVAERLESENVSTVEGLQAVADSEDGVTFQDIGPVSAGQPIPALGRAQELVEAVFSLDAGERTDPVAVPQGQAIALVKEALPERDQEFDEVQDQVRAKLSVDRRKERAVQALADAKTRLDGGTDLDTVAGELGATVEESDEFGAQGMIQNLGFNPQVARAALDMEVGEVGGPYEAGNGAVLFQVSERTAWDPAAFAQEQDTTRSRLEQESLNRFLSSLIRERREDLDIVYNPALIDPEDPAAGA